MLKIEETKLRKALDSHPISGKINLQSASLPPSGWPIALIIQSKLVVTNPEMVPGPAILWVESHL